VCGEGWCVGEWKLEQVWILEMGPFCEESGPKSEGSSETSCLFSEIIFWY
jgi:hypothetical protein